MNGWPPGIRSGSCWAGWRWSAAARELVGLLDATSARPSANSVIGGVLALLVANWLPHVAVPVDPLDGVSALTYDVGEPLNVLAWPFLCFAAVLMVIFVVQSFQFEKPGRHDGEDRRDGPGCRLRGTAREFHDSDALV